MDKYLLIWNQTKEKIKDTYDEEVYNQNFRDITNILKVTNGTIYLLCNSPLIKTKIEKFYSNQLQNILSSLTSEKLRFKFVTADQVTEQQVKEVSQAPTSEVFKSNLNASYQFDSFVVGESNKFAFRIATQVSNPDQGVYIANPLYIFGGVGLGKTHLMQAIGNAILDNDPTKKVLYIQASTFVDDYSKAAHYAKRHKSDNEEINYSPFEEFHKKYDDLDALLVDDIQSLQGAKRSQMEFFNLFNKMHDNNKLIVITSDKPADQLKDIMDRLTSRFNWGLAVDIKVPDLEHRVKILKRKLSDTHDKVVDDKVLSFIASNFSNNIRELEAALNRIINMAIVNESDITLDFAKMAIEPLIQNRKNSGNLDQYENLKSIVADFYHITVEDLIGPKRQALYTNARHICMYILKTKYGLVYDKIGSIVGNRDHSTVMAGVAKISHNAERDEKTKMAIDYIMKKIG